MVRLIRSPWTYTILGLVGYYLILFGLLSLPEDLSEIATVNPLRTLLGGLTTGLITAQALVFTITLVAAQLNARYTHRMASRVLNWPTALYMGLFIGSSIYAAVVLALLSRRPENFALPLPGWLVLHPVTLALALAGTCLLLLIPYLWSFRNRLDPERMAREEGRRAKISVSRDPQREPGEIASLDNIVMSAFGFRDYDTFNRGLTELSDVGLEAWRQSQNSLGESILRRIAFIGVATISDPRAPVQVIEVLEGAGAALNADPLPEAARQTAVMMSEIGEAATGQDRIALVRRVAEGLSNLGELAAQSSTITLAEEAAYSLGYLGIVAARRGQEDSTRYVGIMLRRLASRAVELNLELASRQAMTSLWSLGAAAWKFAPGCADVLVQEMEVLERLAGPERIDATYSATPQGPELEQFRIYYLKEVGREAPESDTHPAPGQTSNSGTLE